jgi:predicted extracellular nuclease|nr:endonuclease/exonuclease/phosphatase family protein [uncultured Bacteroides sp.]
MVGFAVCCCCLAGKAQQTFCIMEYNVENLFDCRHDSLKQDEEFLPGSVRHWTWKKYQDKVNKIGKVVLAASAVQVPDIVGLCEVENESCITRLVRYSPLRDAAYRYVMTDSPDERGIDVALLYQPHTFRLIAYRSIRIPLRKLRRPTRDILHVTGRVVSGDTLDIFLCHLPSRSGGQKKSEPYRLAAASLLKEQTDSVMGTRKDPHVVIMGDFNDYPPDRSIREVLGASRPGKEVEPRRLYNLMDGKKKGTYRYKGEWGILDQMIVSGTLLTGASGITTSYEKARILDFPFLLEEDEQYGGDKPFRTYRGYRYHGGYSDHLPVVLHLDIRE